MKMYGLLGMAGILLAGCVSSSTASSVNKDNMATRNSQDLSQKVTEPALLLPNNNEPELDLAEKTVVFAADTAEEWNGTDLTDEVSENAIRVLGSQIVSSKENISIDCKKIYRLSGEFLLKEQPQNPKMLQVYLGFLMYTKEGRRIFSDNIRPRPDTDTILTRPCTKADTSIYIADGQNWDNHDSSVIAFDTFPNYQDLPNFKTTLARKIVNIEKLSNNEYRVDLNSPCGYDAASGSGVRQHYAWDSMYTAGHETLIPGEWIKLSGVVTGRVESGMPENHFGPGIEKIGIMFLANWKDDNSTNTMLVRNIRLQEISENGLTDTERAELAR